MRARSIHDSIDCSAVSTTTRFISSIVQQYRASRWDVIGGALRRIVSLLLMAEGELPEVREIYREVALELDMPIAGAYFRLTGSAGSTTYTR